jgi:MinD-like ATPase involved in chromosome partitioning or flagellar assembly
MAVKFKQDHAPGMLATRKNDRGSNIIVFTSAKGGCGCSFLVNTVAAFMARKTTLNVLLVDFNAGRMDSRITFGLENNNTRHLGDLPPVLEDLDTFSLKKIVINMEDSLNIILPPLEIDDQHILDTGNLNILIEAIRDHFDLICLDMPGNLLGCVDISEVDISDRFVFISLPDIFSINNTRLLMDYIKDYRSGFDFYLVINKYNLRPALSTTGLSNIVQFPITTFIPYDRDIENMVKTRGPGSIFKYNLKIVRNISGLAGKIYEGLEI